MSADFLTNNDYYTANFYDMHVDNQGQYIGKSLLSSYTYENLNKGLYKLYSVRAQDIHGNYIMLHENDLTGFGEKFSLRNKVKVLKVTMKLS